LGLRSLEFTGARFASSEDAVATIERFEQIEAWQEARKLTNALYELTSEGKFARDFGLRDQIRRAAVSVMSNIAEGFERGGDREFIQFLSLAKGSAGEIRSQLYVAFDQHHLSQTQFEDLANQALHLGRLLAGFMNYLKKAQLGRVKYKPAETRPETRNQRLQTS
jgi:four helix bundle protein